MYAYIEWFRVPDYPMGGTPSVVRVQDTGVVCNIAKVMSICDIDPSRVIIGGMTTNIVIICVG